MTHRFFLLLAVLALAAFTAGAVEVAAGDWPQWRGPNRDDVSTETGLLKEWPAEGLALMGMEPLARVTEPFHFFVARQQERCPARLPRRVGIPQKRPLF